MKGYKITLAWVCTVILGSIGLPIWFNFFENGSILNFNQLDEFLGIILLCVICSAILSVPTLITLLITNAALKSKKLSLKRHFWKVNLAHLIAAFITLLVIDGIIFYNVYQTYNSYKNLALGMEMSNIDMSEFFMPLLWFALVILWYMIVALVCWSLFFLKEIKLIRASKLEVEETIVIDN